MVKTLERHRYALCEKHVIVPFCCSYQVYRYLAGCFGLISCRHYLDQDFEGAEVSESESNFLEDLDRVVTTLSKLVEQTKIENIEDVWFLLMSTSCGMAIAHH